MKIWNEFFQDLSGAGSMTRLLLFGTFVIASIIMLWLCFQEKMSEGYMTMYFAFPASTYGFGKYQDAKVAIANPNPPAQGG